MWKQHFSIGVISILHIHLGSVFRSYLFPPTGLLFNYVLDLLCFSPLHPLSFLYSPYDMLDKTKQCNVAITPTFNIQHSTKMQSSLLIMLAIYPCVDGCNSRFQYKCCSYWILYYYVILLFLAFIAFETSAFVLDWPNTVKSLVEVILLINHSRTVFEVFIVVLCAQIC